MVHFFNDDVAVEVGLNGAIILNHLHYWLKKNADNEMNYHDGYYWTYNSVSAFKKQFPFWSEKTIGRILKDLENDGYIKTGNYNPSTYDRTKWYALTEKSIKLLASPIVQEYNSTEPVNTGGNAIGQNGEMQEDNLSNSTMTECPNEITQSESFHLDKMYKSTINKNKHKEKHKDSNGQTDEIQQLINFCNENVAILTPFTMQMLESYADDFGCEWVQKAMEKVAALSPDKRNVRYIGGVLEGWKRDGVPKPWGNNKQKKELSVQDFMAEQERQRKAQEERDSWMIALLKQREMERENAEFG